MGIENVNVYLYESEFHLARGICDSWHQNPPPCSGEGSITRVADPGRAGDHPDPTCKKIQILPSKKIGFALKKNRHPDQNRQRDEIYI